jgi:branched-chain amino acid aminotransferase
MIAENDRGFLLGDGLFETLLVAKGVALWRIEHLARMAKSAVKLGIAFDADRIGVAVDDVIRKSGDGAQVLRISLSRGVTERGLASDSDESTLSVSILPFDTSKIGQPLSLATSSVRRNPSSISDRHKTLSYINNIHAAREAKARGADDALILNIDGLVASTSIANIFIVTGKQLATPPEGDGVLPGIMRKHIIENAGNFGYSVSVRSFERDELQDASAVFVTNSLRFVSPVRALDGENLQSGDVTDLMKALLADAKVQCGANIVENGS